MEAPVLDLQTLKIVHPHGDELVPMELSGAPHHDAVAHDPERGDAQQRGGGWRRIWRCTSCDETIVLEGRVTGDAPAGSGERAG
jgi:hypothetical protein